MRVDGRLLPKGSSGAPLPVDPGSHEITATTPGTAPFQTRIAMTEGARVSVVIPLDSEPRPAARRPDRTGAFVATGAGIALLAAAGVTLALRESDIGTLNDACPGGACPVDRRDELSSLHSRAKLEGPLAAVFGGVGLVSLGVGVYLLITQTRSESAPAAARPSLWPKLTGGAAPGGGHLSLERAF